jgi:hypothetical protein
MESIPNITTIYPPTPGMYYTLTDVINLTKNDPRYKKAGQILMWQADAESYECYQFQTHDTNKWEDETLWVPFGGGIGGLPNITSLYPLSLNLYYTLATALAALDVRYRASGVLITFEVSNGKWEVWQFLGSLTDWADTTKWVRLINQAEYQAKIDEIEADLANLHSDKANKIKYPAVPFDGTTLNVSPPRILQFDTSMTPELDVSSAGDAGVLGWPVLEHHDWGFGFWKDSVNGDGKTRVGSLTVINGIYTEIISIYNGDAWTDPDGLGLGKWELKYGINSAINGDVSLLSGFDLATGITIPALPSEDLIDVSDRKQDKIITKPGERNVVTSQPLGGLDGLTFTLSDTIDDSLRKIPVNKAVDDAIGTVTSSLATETSNRQEVEANLLHLIESQAGRGGALTAHDFGSETPSQEDLIQYACEDIWKPGGTFTFDSTNPADSTYETTLNGDSITRVASEIFTNTWVRNTNNDTNHRWVLTNTQDTNPPVYVWADVGVDTTAQATDSFAGIMKLYNDDTFGNDNVDGTYTQNQITEQLSYKAVDSTVVHKATAETITGIKTFSVEPVLPAKTTAATTSTTSPAVENQVKLVENAKQNKVPASGDGNIDILTNSDTDGEISYLDFVYSWGTDPAHSSVPSEKLVKDTLDTKAVDTTVVHVTGNETVAGVKTFSSELVLPANTASASDTNTAPAVQSQVYEVEQAKQDKVTTGSSILTQSDTLGTFGTLEKVDSWSATLSDDNIPTEKLTKDTLDLKAETVNNIPLTTNTQDIKLTYVFDTEAEFLAAEASIPVGAIIVKNYEYPLIEVLDKPLFPYIHWDFKDMPLVPDGTAKYRSDFSAGLDGWYVAGGTSATYGSLVNQGGSIYYTYPATAITGTYLMKSLAIAPGDFYIIRWKENVSTFNTSPIIFNPSGTSVYTVLYDTLVEDVTLNYVVRVPDVWRTTYIIQKTAYATIGFYTGNYSTVPWGGSIASVYVGSGLYSTPIKDKSGNGIDLTYVRGCFPIRDNEVPSGWALKQLDSNDPSVDTSTFDGATNSLAMASNVDTANTQFYGPFTISCWFYLYRHSTQLQHILGNWEGGGYGLHIRKSTDTPSSCVDFLVYDRTASTYASITTATSIPVKTWVHLVGIWDGSKLKLYMNGVLAGQIPFTGSVGYSNVTPLMLFANPTINGNTSREPGRYCKIADVKIFDYALTDDNVKQLHKWKG